MDLIKRSRGNRQTGPREAGGLDWSKGEQADWGRRSRNWASGGKQTGP
jgi:hypothetical protein